MINSSEVRFNFTHGAVFGFGSQGSAISVNRSVIDGMFDTLDYKNCWAFAPESSISLISNAGVLLGPYSDSSFSVRAFYQPSLNISKDTPL